MLSSGSGQVQTDEAAPDWPNSQNSSMEAPRHPDQQPEQLHRSSNSHVASSSASFTQSTDALTSLAPGHRLRQDHHLSITTTPSSSSAVYQTGSAQLDSDTSSFRLSHHQLSYYYSPQDQPGPPGTTTSGLLDIVPASHTAWQQQPHVTSQHEPLQPEEEDFLVPKSEPISPPRPFNTESSPHQQHQATTWDSMPSPAAAARATNDQDNPTTYAQTSSGAQRASGAAHSRKRSQDDDDAATSTLSTAIDDGEARPKKRGRPRLAEPDKSTYLERRRTQVRVAQQKYRNKKEQSIIDLEQQVREEKAQRKALEREFQNFLSLLQDNDTMLHSPEDVLSSFTALRQRFFYAEPDQETQEQGQENQSTTSSASGRNQLHPTANRRQPTLGTISSSSSDRYPGMASATRGTHSNQGHNASLASAATSYHHTESPLYEIIADPTAENASFPQFVPDPNNPGSWIAQTPVAQGQPLQSQSRAQAHQGADPSLSLMRMPPPASYAPQEGTFGRRLARTTLERGLVLATMANPPPDRFGSVFGFCLLFESRERIVRRLNDRLRAMNQETLSNWKFPFTNLGGAGLNYISDHPKQGPPIGDDNYRAPFKPEHMTGLQMGPMEEDVADVRDKYISNDMKMKLSGFEGDFLDSMEVERYLRDRGIDIPANAEFVYAELNPAHFGDGQATDTVPVQVIGAHMYNTNAMPASMDQTQDWSIFGATPVFGTNTGPTAPDVNSLNPFLCPAVPEAAWTSKDPTNLLFAAKINVPLLVEEMVRRSVCLGRSPGVRPKDVDRAVKIASGLFKPLS